MPQVELVRTWLIDGPVACDRDGVLDEGESGFLNVTLKNQGAFNVNTVELKLTSSNPHLIFTNGDVVSFPPIPAGAERTGSIRVSLSGASGIETADIRIEVIAPELQLPSGLSVVATHRVNYDERPAASTTDSVEPVSSAWTVGGGSPTSPNVARWQRRALSPTQHVWWGPDNNGQTDGVRPDGPDEQYLMSPELTVGSGPLGLAFSHRFSFESTGWDGGVIELSTDGGASWTDIGTAAYNGSTNGVTAAPIGASRPAFVNRMTGWPNFTNVSLNLGTAFAGQTVRVRFRIGADESTGAPGWDIDDIAVSGITNQRNAGPSVWMASCSCACSTSHEV